MRETAAKLEAAYAASVVTAEQETSGNWGHLVRRHLRAILTSDTFGRSPQARRFLEYVAEHSLTADVEALKAYTIGVNALGANTERSCPETTARMQASRVRRLLAKYYDTEGKEDAVQLQLPTGCYVLRVGQPPLAAMTLGAPGVVVEPLENLSEHPSDDSLARGLGERILELLVHAEHLRVTQGDMGAVIAGDYVLGGSLTRVGGQVRMQCTLRLPSTGATLWSERFERDLSNGDYLAVQDDVALLVASRVGDPAVGVVARTRRDLDSSDRVTAGLTAFFRLLAGPSVEGLHVAKAALEQALPERRSAPVHGAYACVLSLLYLGSARTRAAELRSAEAHARTAVSDDATCALSHLGKAMVHYHQRERASAERCLQQALEREPAAAMMRAIAGNLFALMGDWKRGLELVEDAKAANPDLPGYVFFSHCLYHLLERAQPGEALRYAEQIELPGTVWSDLLSACCMAGLGRPVDVRKAISRVLAQEPAFAKRASDYLSECLFRPEHARSLLALVADSGLAPRNVPPGPKERYRGPHARRAAEGAVSVGILQSLSGTMAISETHLVNAAMLAIEEINHAGGVLGRPVRGVVEDGASNALTFREKAEKLLEQDGVDCLFGCWTSSSRKAVRRVVEAHNALLWYPLQYEGLERSRNIVYTGSCLNQQIEPAVRWALKQGRTRCFLVGSDYVFPRTANRLIRALVEAAGGVVVGERYEPLGEGNFEQSARDISDLAPQIIYNTVNGSDNLALFAALRRAGVEPEETPVMSFSLSELELARAGGLALGHLACWSYFQSMEDPENQELVRRFRGRYGESEVLSDPAVTAYSQVHLWKDVVERAGCFEVEALLKHLAGSQLRLGGEALEVQENHHVQRRAAIGRVRRDDQFEILWRSLRPIAPQPWLGVDEADFVTRDLVLGALRALPELAEQHSELEGRFREPSRMHS